MTSKCICCEKRKKKIKLRICTDCYTEVKTEEKYEGAILSKVFLCSECGACFFDDLIATQECCKELKQGEDHGK